MVLPHGSLACPHSLVVGMMYLSPLVKRIPQVKSDTEGYKEKAPKAQEGVAQSTWKYCSEKIARGSKR